MLVDIYLFGKDTILFVFLHLRTFMFILGGLIIYYLALRDILKRAVLS